jgi:hypothetical protein
MILLSSCVSTKTLYKGLTKGPSTLAYIFDSETAIAEKVDTIGIMQPKISDQGFAISSDLKKVKSSAIPLLIYTGWNSEHEYTIGEDVINENLSDFVQESLIWETNRSSSLYADSLTSNNMTLEIEIDSIGAAGPYRSSGYVLFLLLAYSYSESESAGPGIAYSKLNYRLRDQGKIVLKGNVENHIETEPLVNTFKSTNELRQFYTDNLVEALSLTIKSNVEEIVKRIDGHYEHLHP